MFIFTFYPHDLRVAYLSCGGLALVEVIVG